MAVILPPPEVLNRGSFVISLRPPSGETSTMLGFEEYMYRRRRDIAMVPDWECNKVHKSVVRAAAFAVAQCPTHCQESASHGTDVQLQGGIPASVTPGTDSSVSPKTAVIAVCVYIVPSCTFEHIRPIGTGEMTSARVLRPLLPPSLCSLCTRADVLFLLEL